MNNKDNKYERYDRRWRNWWILPNAAAKNVTNYIIL